MRSSRKSTGWSARDESADGTGRRHRRDREANRVDRFLYRAHLEREDLGPEGHDLSDPTDDWLDEVWDAAEAIRLYGSEETAAAALNGHRARCPRPQAKCQRKSPASSRRSEDGGEEWFDSAAKGISRQAQPTSCRNGAVTRR